MLCQSTRKARVRVQGGGAEHDVEAARRDLRHVTSHDLVTAFGHDRRLGPRRFGAHAERQKANAKRLGHFAASGKMTVKSPFSKVTNNSATCPTNGTTQTSLPTNGVIYVQKVPATKSDPNYTKKCPYTVNGESHPTGLPTAKDSTR